MKEQQVDMTIRNEGSLFLFRPLTSAASDWLEENVSGESTWFGDSLVVEHRYARDLAEGMQRDGLVLE